MSKIILYLKHVIYLYNIERNKKKIHATFYYEKFQNISFSQVENEVKDKMIASLKNNFKDDTITNSDSISNAWNYMFMTVGTIYMKLFESTGE